MLKFYFSFIQGAKPKSQGDPRFVPIFGVLARDAFGVGILSGLNQTPEGNKIQGANLPFLQVRQSGVATLGLLDKKW